MAIDEMKVVELSVGPNAGARSVPGTMVVSVALRG